MGPFMLAMQKLSTYNHKIKKIKKIMENEIANKQTPNLYRRSKGLFSFFELM